MATHAAGGARLQVLALPLCATGGGAAIAAAAQLKGSGVAAVVSRGARQWRGMPVPGAGSCARCSPATGAALPGARSGAQPLVPWPRAARRTPTPGATATHNHLASNAWFMGHTTNLHWMFGSWGRRPPGPRGGCAEGVRRAHAAHRGRPGLRGHQHEQMGAGAPARW